HDVRGAAELQVDALDEGGVERHHQFLIAVDADHANASPRPCDVDALEQRGNGADAFEDGVRTATTGAILDEARSVYRVGINGNGTEALRHLQPLGHRVHRI